MVDKTGFIVLISQYQSFINMESFQVRPLTSLPHFEMWQIVLFEVICSAANLKETVVERYTAS